MSRRESPPSVTGNRCHSDSPQAACINGPRQRTATPISTLNGPNRVSHPASKGEGRTRKRQHLQIQQQEEQQQQRGDLGTTGGNSLEGERQPKKMKQKPQKQLGATEGDSMMLQQLPATRRKVKHGSQELHKRMMLHQGPSQPRNYEQDLQRLQQRGFIVPNMPTGGGSVMVRQLQPQKMTPEQQIKKEPQEQQRLPGVVGATGGSMEPLPQWPRQIKKEQQELQQLGVMGLKGGGSVEPLPQGPPPPQQIKKDVPPRDS